MPQIAKVAQSVDDSFFLELDIVVTVTIGCMCVCAYDFVQTLTFKIVDGFQNDLTPSFLITCRCAILNIGSGRPKVKVTLEDKIFVHTITPTILDGFQYKFAQLFSIMSRCAI